jgi:ABC-type multidrug transport system ATPase subunit
MMPTTILRLDRFSVAQGKFTLAQASFELKSGDIMGLVGRSGSGKSTLLKGMLGRAKILAGTVSLMGETPIGLRDVVGYSPQENSLYPFLTLQENMFTFGALYGLDHATILDRMFALVKRLDLQGHEHKRIFEMSGGMQKRADLAVTLIHNPRVILLDEPFNGLDISLQRFIWQFLHDLASEGKIIIVSSHLLADIQKNCNQFGLVERGYFYGTDVIMRYLKANKTTSLEDFLQNVFTTDLLAEKGGN